VGGRFFVRESLALKWKREPQNFTACVVCVCDEAGDAYGTGFVVAEGIVATCAHVVEKAHGGGADGRVLIRFVSSGETRRAWVRDDCWQPVDDVAMLAFEGALPTGVQPARLCVSLGGQGREFRSFGYPRVGDVEGVWARGTVMGYVIQGGREVLQLDSKELTRGFSGAPIMLSATGHVVGMVSSVFFPGRDSPKMPHTAFAVSTETLQAVCPGLELAPLPSLPRFRVAYLAAGSLALVALLVLFLVRPWSTPAGLFLQPYQHHLLEGRDLTEVAAAGRYVWFGTRSGLVWHNVASGQTNLVSGVTDTVKAMAVSHAGSTAWFALPGGRIGCYKAGETEPEWFEPGDGKVFNTVLSIVVAPDEKTTWFGDSCNGVFCYTVEEGWSPLSASLLGTGLPPLRRVEELKPGPGNALWVDGTLFVYRLLEGQWAVFDEEGTGKKLPNSVNALLVDAHDRIWFAHDQGITVLASGADSHDAGDQVWQRCEPDGRPLPPGRALGLASSDEGRVIWIATENGLVQVNAGRAVLPEDCSRWDWGDSWPQEPELADFWEADVRLAVNEYVTQGGKRRVTAWIIKRDTDRVFCVDWQ